MSWIDRTISVLTLALATAVVPVGSAAAEDCPNVRPRRAGLDARGASLLRVEAAAGSLRIEGRAGLAEVRAEGQACADRPDIVERIRLEAERRGDVLEVRVRMPEEMFGGDHDARLDLTLEMPETLALEVSDGSGPADIRNVAALRAEDGSGDLRVEGVAGDARITDGSGELRVSGVGGNLTVEDGSGDIVAREIAGGVSITDGSGEIDLDGVEADVLIDEDGSGGIQIARVGGSVRIETDGSGEIDVVDVAGDFTVETDGSGGVDFRDVRGRVSVP